MMQFEQNLRNYRDTDYDVVLKLLHLTHIYDVFTNEILREKLYDDPEWSAENTFVFESEGSIVGFIQGVTRQIRGLNYGYVKLLAVDEKYRRRGIASAMLNKLLSKFKDIKVDVVRIYDVPLNYFMPGIDPRYTPAFCFAEKNGFKKFGDTANLEVDLNQNWNTEEEIAAILNEEIEIKRAEESDKEAVMQFLETEWQLWKNEAEQAYLNHPVSMFIARQNGKVKAFSAYFTNNKGTAWFGPMGTHPDLRGKGIGGVLLKMCLQEIKNAGFETAIIPWVGPIAFYSHYASAKLKRVFWRYERHI